ncbi:MAG: GldG family protein [Saprospiraceae bacterium]|nr:GldG family protein [Saprospiraceae bacterium]
MKQNKVISLLLVTGIIIVINMLSKQFFVRLDVTEEKQYTLSQATKDILADLPELISVKAYFSENLPPDLEIYRSDFQDMLVEYSNRSGGNLSYQFVNPNDDPQIEQEAAQNGIQPRLVNVREKDQFTQQKAYMGAVVSLGDLQEVIPFIGPGIPMEYTLTTSIKKMAVVDKPSVAFVQGHGEPAFQDLGQVIQALSVIFSVETLDLATEPQIPDRYRAVVMLGPKDSIPADHFAKIDDYLSRGGDVIVAFDAVTGNFSTAQGTEVPGTVRPWLATKGIEVDPSFVVDASCGTVTVQQRQGFFTFNTPVEFPYIPLIRQFPDHPVSQGLEQVLLQFASPVRYAGDSAMTFTPFLTSSERAGVINTPTFFNVADRQWTSADFPLSNLTIGGVLEGPFGGELPGRLIVISDGDFPVSAGGRGVNPDNVNLLVNAVEWMSDDTGLSALRTKGVASRPIDELEDGKRTFLKYLNFLMPILLVIAYGVYRAQRNRARRMRRMQERYV